MQNQDSQPIEPAREASFEELAAYNHSPQYAAVVEPILEQYRSGVQPENIHGYLGSGDYKHAFRADTTEGPIVVKVMRSELLESETFGADVRELTRTNVAPLLLGRSIPKLEQLLSVDVDNGVLVTTMARGKRVRDMSSLELMGIKQDHLVELQGTLATMQSHNLHPHNSGGIFYDREEGFNFVDYELEDTAHRPVINVARADSVEEFIHYALQNFDGIDALDKLRDQGVRIESKMYDVQTVGLRALARAIILKRVKAHL